jgi:hypothetical protein
VSSGSSASTVPPRPDGVIERSSCVIGWIGPAQTVADHLGGNTVQALGESRSWRVFGLHAGWRHFQPGAKVSLSITNGRDTKSGQQVVQVTW